MDQAPTDARSAHLFADNLKGFLLAVASSAFIGASFIIKKKGLKRAGACGTRAGVGGYGYLLEPLWWIGMVTKIAEDGCVGLCALHGGFNSYRAPCATGEDPELC
ncbi:hypothetical protein GW17_00005498 [Ensete ventricosum]|nr:hypothetical protein GW17_00005498 [Ensete ventricosum]